MARLAPAFPQPGECKRLFTAPCDAHGNLDTAGVAPFVETVRGNQTPALLECFAKCRASGYCFAARIDHACTFTRCVCPAWHQAPAHDAGAPAFSSVPDDENILLWRNVVARTIIEWRVRQPVRRTNLFTIRRERESSAHVAKLDVTTKIR